MNHNFAAFCDDLIAQWAAIVLWGKGRFGYGNDDEGMAERLAESGDNGIVAADRILRIFRQYRSAD